MGNSELRAALRTLYREKSYALINLCGLSLAITSFLILALYLKDELTYDRHHVRHKEIFRIAAEITQGGSPETYAVTSLAMGPLLKKNFADAKDYVRFTPAGGPKSAESQKLLIRAGDKAIYWNRIFCADDNVFDVFTHKIIYGDPRTALKDPTSAAVSETFAKSYFGDENPIGKTIQADLAPQILRKITLVFRDLPENTHLKYDALFHQAPGFGGLRPEQLVLSADCYTYLVMPKNYDVDHFKALNDFYWARYLENIAKRVNASWKSWLQPLTDIHLYSDLGRDLPVGSRYHVFGLSAVAAFILLVACINYVNLAIARAAKRSREIGMRKILGVSRIRLISRFLAESIFLSIVATIISAVLVQSVFKFTPIHSLLGKPLALNLKEQPILLLYMLGISLFVGLLSGLYPAFYLSSVKPTSAMASSLAGNGSFRLREMLVLFQFTVSVAVIACTMIMAAQIRYVSGKPLGFEKHSRVVIHMPNADVAEKYELIKNELSKDSHILGITARSGVSFNPMAADSNAGVPENLGLLWFAVTDSYMNVMGMELVTGRDFSRLLLTDIGAGGHAIVNEAMVKARGWQQPLGKRIGTSKIIGVVKDFHFKSLYNAVQPVAIFRYQEIFPPLTVIIKISDHDVLQTLKFVQDKFAIFDPRHPFEYEFLDDTIDNQYLSDNNLMQMTAIFSGICIFISCLGLSGLAAFATEQRNKEIGIRKVLGASISQIIMMLARKTLWLVLAGSVIASAVAYFAMNEWLSRFAYRITIHPQAFVISAAVVTVLAFTTIALQSYRAAKANPARVIRYE
jgi:putative ABC transport system permease protein